MKWSEFKLHIALTAYMNVGTCIVRDGKEPMLYSTLPHFLAALPTDIDFWLAAKEEAISIPLVNRNISSQSIATQSDFRGVG